MLGRPKSWKPVFIKIWAGAWLNRAAFMERTMAISSATFIKWERSSEISARLATLLELVGRAQQLRHSLDEREALSLHHRLRDVLAVQLLKLGLVVEQIQLRRRETNHAPFGFD